MGCRTNEPNEIVRAIEYLVWNGTFLDRKTNTLFLDLDKIYDMAHRDCYKESVGKAIEQVEDHKITVLQFLSELEVNGWFSGLMSDIREQKARKLPSPTLRFVRLQTIPDPNFPGDHFVDDLELRNSEVYNTGVILR